MLDLKQKQFWLFLVFSGSLLLILLVSIYPKRLQIDDTEPCPTPDGNLVFMNPLIFPPSVPPELLKIISDTEYLRPEDFEGFNNVTGVDQFIVPNILHFIRFNRKTIEFVEYLCIIGAYKVQKPNFIYIHTNEMKMEGYYWQKLQKQIGHVIMVRYKELASNINGLHGTYHVYHYSDVARIQILMEYGGIYLDADSLLLKSMDPFRKFEMTLGWTNKHYLGTQVLVAHRNARFLRKWLQTYLFYDPDRWYYNAGELPTTSVLNVHPELVHVVQKHFGVRSLAYKLYDSNWNGWKDGYYAIHLLIGHRHYMSKQDVFETGIDKNFNEENIKGYDRSFGQMARWVLYNTTDLLATPLPRKKVTVT